MLKVISQASQTRFLGVRLSERKLTVIVYSVAIGLYFFGAWLHIPYGGGHIYSDIPSVFQTRECPKVCDIKIPYIQTFFEYPVVVSMFIYAMGELGGALPGSLLSNYYWFTVAFLLIPTLLLVRELQILARMRGRDKAKVLWYFVVTPTFVYVLLLNWYVIGTYFAISGLRRYLQGQPLSSGLFFGLSAASNLVTAAPVLGLLVASKNVRERLALVLVGGATYLLINTPFIVLNFKLWYEAFHFVYNWYTEDSWILAVSNDNYSPLRHVIPPVVFGVILLGMLIARYKGRSTDPVVYAFVSMAGYVFSSYIYTPQENVALLPFFVLLPLANSYVEFLAFDAANSLIIILGFSQALYYPFGISYQFAPFTPYGLVWWIEVIRSLWVGKFVALNGFPRLFVPSLGRVHDRLLRRGNDTTVKAD